MRPAKFEYFGSFSVDETLRLLDCHSPEARVLAGGLSLVPAMRLRLAEPKYVIDITRIPTLSYVVETPDGGLSIGALTTYQSVLTSKVVQSKCRILAEIAGNLTAQVRNRGTLGGSICHADPAGDFSPAILALNAQLKVTGSQGERIIKGSSFYLDFFTTALKPTELLTDIVVPPWSANTGSAYLKLTRRSGDFAIVSAAVVITVDQKNTCLAAGIGLGAVGTTPIRAVEAEKTLIGNKINEELIDKASRLASKGTKPSTDIHASASYRAEMIPIITKRALKQALERAGGGK